MSQKSPCFVSKLVFPGCGEDLGVFEINLMSLFSPRNIYHHRNVINVVPRVKHYHYRTVITSHWCNSGTNVTGVINHFLVVLKSCFFNQMKSTPGMMIGPRTYGK